MKPKELKGNSGFTLIETIIYVAIFAFIMTGALVSTYAIFGSNSRNQTKAMIAEEGAFLLGKIDFVLTGARTITAPNDGDPTTMDHSDSLQVVKFDGTATTLEISGEEMKIDRGSGFLTLNNSNTQIECPPSPSGCFKHESTSGDGINPENVEARFFIKSKTSEGQEYSQEFSTIKYLRR